MLPQRVGLASRSQSIGLHDLARVAAALNLQASRDLQSIWNISATVVTLPNPDSIEPGIWPIFILDHLPGDGAGGVHLTEHHQPYALVQAGQSWSLTASHECVEMLVDPSANRLVSSSAITVVDNEIKDLPSAKFEYLVEAADPSQDPANAYMIDDVVVADFYTPHFFDPVTSPGVRYSFTGKITRPRQILKNGYISWLNPALGTMQQLMNFPEGPAIRNLSGKPSESKRGTLRGFVDSQTKSPFELSSLGAMTDVARQQAARAEWLQRASTLRSAHYTLAFHPTGAVE